MKALLKVLSLLFAVQAFAIPNGPCGDTGCCGEKRAECCIPAPGPFAFANCKDIGLACPNDFYIFGDFLLMHASQDGLEYAISYSPCDPIITNAPLAFPVTNGDIIGFSSDSKSWHWNEGFRVGFGFVTGKDCWNLEATWTSLNITNSTSTSLNGSGVLIPLWMEGAPQRGYGSDPLASARWKADFNTFDITLARPFHVSRYMIMSPHFGLRFAFIDQYYQVEYSGVWGDSVATGGGIDGGSFTADNDFRGVGTRAGVDTEWQMACGAGLYANVAASILYGQFDIDQTWLAGESGDRSNDDLDYEFYMNSPNLEIQMGVFWGMFFCDMRYHVAAKLGYEFHVWWDQNNMRRWTDGTTPIYNDTVSRGDLTLNGLAFRLQFDF